MVAQIAGRFASSALARPTPVRFSQRLLARCETHRTGRSASNTFHCWAVQHPFARNLLRKAPLPHQTRGLPGDW
jgi:hypothetical protein